MGRRVFVSLLSVVFFCLAQPIVAAGDAIGIPRIVPFDDNADVPEAVRAECQLGEKVANFLEKNRSIEFSDNPEQGRYVEMSITEVFAPSGGAWSGPKWMEVTGTLNENGKEVASFRAKRFSTGGAFGGFKGTCAIIGRCTKVIAKDIAQWLKDPVDGAELGDAK